VKDKNEPKLAQKNKVLYKRFKITHSEGKPIIEHMIIKRVQSFCNEMKVTDRCTFLEGWLQNLKHQHLQDTYKWKTFLFTYFPTDNSHLTYNAHPKLFYIPFEVQITRT